MRLSFCAIALSCAFAAPQLAHATTYTYTVNMLGLQVSFDEPEILTVDTTIPAADWLSTSNPYLTDVYISPTLDDCFSNPIKASCAVISQNGTGIGTDFSTDLTSVGTYEDSFGDFVSIVADASPSAAPEPSTLALLGTGILMLAGAGKKAWRLLGADQPEPASRS
jgi:hypothetical protein